MLLFQGTSGNSEKYTAENDPNGGVRELEYLYTNSCQLDARGVVSQCIHSGTHIGRAPLLALGKSPQFRDADLHIQKSDRRPWNVKILEIATGD